MNKTINIALIGHGKMGREVEKLAIQQGHTIVVIIDREEDWKTRKHELQKADVAIEFSTPTSAPSNIERCFLLGIPVVSGTTGWSSQLPRVKETCIQNDGTLFYASNFSLGVNIFFEMNRKLARMLAPFGQYKPNISETHHTQKIDAPSGTAVTLANDIVGLIPGLNRWILSEGKVKDDELPIEALRLGNVIGTHKVTYQGPDDQIEMTHTAHNRSALAQGALLAATWVAGRKGVFTMKDLLKF